MPVFDIPKLTLGNVAAAMKSAAAKAGKVYMVDIEFIRVLDDYNPRVHDSKYDARVDWLVNQYEQVGFLPQHPLSAIVAESITDDENKALVLYLQGGHRRLEAVHKFNEKRASDDKTRISELPVVVRAPGSATAAELQFALIAENEGDPFTPYEQAVVVRRLLGMSRDGGMETFTAAEVAGRLGKTERYISDLMALISGPEEIHAMVRTGRIAATLAVQELRAAGDKPEIAVARIKAGLAAVEAAGGSTVTAKYLPAPAPVKANGKAPTTLTKADVLARMIREAIDELNSDGVAWLRELTKMNAKALGEFEKLLNIKTGSLVKLFRGEIRTVKVKAPPVVKTDKAKPKVKTDAEKKAAAERMRAGKQAKKDAAAAEASKKAPAPVTDAQIADL